MCPERNVNNVETAPSRQKRDQKRAPRFETEAKMVEVTVPVHGMWLGVEAFAACIHMEHACPFREEWEGPITVRLVCWKFTQVADLWHHAEL